MAGGEETSSISEELLEEIESIKAIYEGQVSSVIGDTHDVSVTLYNVDLLINFNINREYPDEIPQVKVLNFAGDHNKLQNILENRAREITGNSMLYALIAKALEMASDVETVSSQAPAKTQCKFYKEGKCRFGSKCFNLHGNTPPQRVENTCAESTLEFDSLEITSEEEDGGCRAKKVVTPTKDVHREKKVATPTKDIYGEKKKPMKTAIDVINRILWDESFPTENFTVGYLDRFLGVQEKPFTAFSWEDIASVDYNVLAIPKHRIQYFKYKSIIVWDKNERMDKIFGSTGDEVTIMDVINSESVPDIETNEKEDDESEEDELGCQYSTRNRPNYFLVLRVQNEEVRQNIVKIQESITYYDDRLKQVSFKPEDFHVTLCMMRLKNEGEFVKAGAVLKSLERILVCLLPSGKSFITIKGITDFRAQVVVADVLKNPSFNKFVEIAKLKLKDAGISLVGNHDPYCPHLTLLKLTRPFCRDHNMDRLNNMYYSPFKDTYIGQQAIDEIRICSVGEERGYDDFYVSLSTISNNLFCVSPKLPSLVSAHVQNLMGAGLILEDEGDEMLTELLSDDAGRFELIVLSLEKLLPSYSDFYTANKKHVVIMRGLPGSGKSHFVQMLHESSKDNVSFGICGADEYFLNKESGYKFADSDIASAHMFCQDKFIDCIVRNCDIIVVDNTHVQKWEYQIYERISLLCGYQSHVVSINCNNETERCAFLKRCRHKVSPHVHKHMSERFEHDDEALCVDSETTSVNLDELLTRGSVFSLCSASVLYSALYLDDESRDLLLSIYPPVHAQVTCDHVTLIYGPSSADLSNTPVGSEKSVSLSGYVVNNHVQAVLVRGVDGVLSSTDKTHVTISTNQGTPPKEVLYWINHQPCLPPVTDIVLSGVVGVQIATSKTQSKKCIDADQFSLILSKLSSENCCVTNGNDSSNDIPRNDTGTRKGADSSVIDAADIYFGPEVVESLFVFDFDGTLFNTPGPADGRRQYEYITGSRWPHRGWLGIPESLHSPLHVYPGPSLSTYFDHYDRACSKTVLLTGRLQAVRSGLEPVLAANGLTFADIIMKPQFSSTVHSFKKEIVKGLMKKLPRLKSVKFWDDRSDNIQQIKNLQKTCKGIEMDVIHVDRAMPSFNDMHPSDVLMRMGVRPTPDYNRSVEAGLDYISQICTCALGLTGNRKFLYTFGSRLLGRRGDVDVCVLAPSRLPVDQYIKKIGETAKSYGLEYVHVASGIRCPLVKLKIRFTNLPPVEYDIVVAAVLEDADGDDDSDDDVNFEKLNRNCTDKKSKAVMEGLTFFDKIVSAVLDRIDVHDFGLVIDAVNVTLKRNSLKGNLFHCIRTFHVVKLLAKFLQSCAVDILPPHEGWHTLREFEKFVRHFFSYLSGVSADDYRKLFKGFVPDVYIEPLRTCFRESSECTVLDLLFTAPDVSVNLANVKVELQGADKVQLWRGMCLTEARLGTCVRGLIQNGVAVRPGAVSEGTICFSATPSDISSAVLTNFKKELLAELPREVSLKVDIPV